MILNKILGKIGNTAVKPNVCLPTQRHFWLSQPITRRSLTRGSFQEDSSAGSIQQNILECTEVTSCHLTPEIKLHLVTPSCPLWDAREEECPFPDPYWAFYWPGGQALTRYVLDNKSLVSDKVVLDVGSGCGASAIAASLCGASKVIANDICKVATQAISLNASINGVTNVEIDTRNLIGSTESHWDVIFIGDMFYDDGFTTKISEWLRQLHEQGKQIYIGDPGRFYFQTHPIKSGLTKLATYAMLPETKLANNGLTCCYVWTFVNDNSR